RALAETEDARVQDAVGIERGLEASQKRVRALVSTKRAGLAAADAVVVAEHRAVAAHGRQRPLPGEVVAPARRVRSVADDAATREREVEAGAVNVSVAEVAHDDGHVAERVPYLVVERNHAVPARSHLHG